MKKYFAFRLKIWKYIILMEKTQQYNNGNGTMKLIFKGRKL